MPASLRITVLFTLLLCASAQAVELYSGEVAVADQGVTERQDAVRSALIQVLQKHSGQRELPLHPALDAALLDANRMLLSFHYRSHERALPDGSINTELRLVANFRPEAVDQVVRDLELPRWRKERRPVTLWVVVDDGYGRRLMPVEYAYAWDAVSDVARLRGMPLKWPELDEEQLEQVDLQLLWGGFTDQVETAGADSAGVVIVAARREGPAWNLRWNFGGGDETTGWRNSDQDLVFALVEGLHRLVDFVAARDAILPSALGDWRYELVVSGLHSGDDYVRCLAYLEGLGLVDGVAVLAATAGEVTFSLDLNAMPEYLLAEIDRDRRLFGDSQGQRFTWGAPPAEAQAQ